ncbi:Uma2 family endonuclease [Spirulina major CS-329]|uniref:Uma2 family endonuclease n=1 Tax=Spirulina TaxID=1154 RepID=UPI00232D178E|nr:MULTISPECIES: Uma2 family endonuclease [Spirulina]MDB9495685.1 Uma2 family endonuclease [Spirulina subsalsa CS-330]MDB9505344.1 Uma2 family endonuclease [Spirulina major CS-329]
MTAAPLAPTDLRLISTADYHQMAAVGILAEDEQVELITGQIIQKMPKGPAHSALCKILEKLLEQHLGEQGLVRVQDPLTLDRYSEPEPDLAVVKPRPDFYAQQHPQPEDVYLIVEVADSTLDRDLTVKANLYAAAGITDYWVLNVSVQQLHIFRNPQADGYQQQLILKGQETVEVLAFPDQGRVSVQSCFGSVFRR